MRPVWRYQYRQPISASVTLGSNCVPAQRVISRDGGAVRPRRAVGAVGRDRAVGVAGEHDAAAQRDLVAHQVVRVAGAVPVLVLVTDDLRDDAHAGDRLEDALADDRVLAHEVPLGVVERARLVEDAVRHADLADVVQLRRGGDGLHVAAVHPELLGDLAREVHDRLELGAVVAVAREHRPGERVDDGGLRGARRDARSVVDAHLAAAAAERAGAVDAGLRRGEQVAEPVTGLVDRDAGRYRDESRRRGSPPSRARRSGGRSGCARPRCPSPA